MRAESEGRCGEGAAAGFGDTAVVHDSHLRPLERVGARTSWVSVGQRSLMKPLRRLYQNDYH